MKYFFHALTAAVILAAAVPAAAQTLLLDVSQTVPIAATLDNPCSPQPEAIVFTGSTNLTERVWLLPDGNIRVQFYESTAVQGNDALASPLLPAVKYTAAGESMQDFEIAAVSLSVLQYKKVSHPMSDNFHSVLVLSLDPQNLKVDVKLEAACDDGMP
jgi:hypothetical protein